MATTAIAPFTPTDPALTAVMEQAIAAYPAEEARIRRGAEIVARGGIRIDEDGHYLIGIYHYYPVNGTCPCPDRVTSKNRCKHLWGKALYKKMAEPVQSLQFYADLHGIPGVATVYRNGTVVFQAHDSTERITCSDQEIVSALVLGGRKDLVDATWGTV